MCLLSLPHMLTVEKKIIPWNTYKTIKKNVVQFLCPVWKVDHITVLKFLESNLYKIL